MARPLTWRWLVATFLAGILVAGALFWLWRQPGPPSPTAQAALADWLDTSCSAGASQEKDDALRMFGAELERSMIDLFQLGPSRRERVRIEVAARTQIERTQALINSGVPTGLPATDVQALLAVSVDLWARQAGENFDSSRRAAALAGLAITGRGRRLLETVAADANSPFRGVARSVIAAPANPATP